MYPMTPPATVKTVTIASGQTESAAVDLEHYQNFGVVWPTMTEATVTFLVASTGGGTYVELVDDAGTAISVVASDGKGMALPSELSPWRFVKFKSAGAEGADRSIPLVCKA